MIAFLTLLALQPLGTSIPLSATVEAVSASPARFDGRRLQVHGWLNCDRMGCNLYSASATGFLPIENDTRTTGMLKDWAPAYVVMEGRFEDHRFRAPVRASEFITLTVVERSRALRDVRLLRVVREGRRPADRPGE